MIGPRYSAYLLLPVGLAVALGGCDEWKRAAIADVQPVALRCAAARSAEPIPQRRFTGAVKVTVTFDELRQRIDARCRSCHLDASTGGFRYSDALTGSAGRPGLADAADKMAAQMLGGYMPPGDPDPEGTRLLGQTLEAWIAAGKPEGAFAAPATAPPPPGPGAFGALAPTAAQTMTNIGDCVPDATSTRELSRVDEAKDRFFAGAAALPENLTDTDLQTFDSASLALAGIFAYAPTYQLWSDDARKLRLIRVPRGQHVHYDAATRTFRIPPNTRFYKTFFKKVVEPDGAVTHRAIETRLIVSRPSVDGVEQALFGTYLWDESGRKATLWSGEYRDGSPFRDLQFTYTDEFRNCQRDAAGNVVVDPASGAPACDAHQRTYAIPARHRCVQCHQGAEGQNFILGFTPLQVNRRALWEGGVTQPVGDDELSQVDRLLAYGVIDGIESAANLPTLETAAGERAPRNEHELRAQAYLVGNCAHCHNPRGFPVRDEPRLRDLDLSPGGIVFQFPLKKSAVSTALAYYADPLALDLQRPDASLLYRRVATPVTTVWSDPKGTTHLVVPHMPANTPGMDCRAPDLIGRWIASIPINGRGEELASDASPAEVMAAQDAALKRVVAFDAKCLPPDDVVNWVAEDLTEPKIYAPRRPDFDTWTTDEDGVDPFIHPDQIHGIPKVFRDLVVDEGLAQVSATPAPHGFWQWKAGCKFPDDLPANPADAGDHAFYRRPWMSTPSGQPRRPLGEVYFETPGAGIFRAVCSNCHGARADGNSGNAKALLQLSGGQIRVANLMQGLFKNLPRFDAPGANGVSIGPNGAAKYLVWMASGGTTVKFPDGFESLLGTGDKKFGGNMLTKVSYYCSRLLPSQFWIGDLRGDEFEFGIPPEKRELWTLFCTYRNQPIPDPLNIPPDFDADHWIRTAKFNGGLMMYFFFRDHASKGDFPPSAGECERLYGK